MYSSKSPVLCTGVAACLPATGVDVATTLFWFFAALAIMVGGLTLVRLSKSRPAMAMTGPVNRVRNNRK